MSFFLSFPAINIIAVRILSVQERAIMIMRENRKKIIPMLFLLAVSIVSCGNGRNTYYDWEDIFCWDVFERQRAKWEELQIDSYTFTAQSRTSIPPFPVPITVIVLPGMPPALSYEARYEARVQEALDRGFDFMELPFIPFSGKTIDELFQSIAERAAEIPVYADGTPANPRSFTIRYHPRYYFPVFFSSHWPQPIRGGGGVSFRISQFETL